MYRGKTKQINKPESPLEKKKLRNILADDLKKNVSKSAP